MILIIGGLAQGKTEFAKTIDSFDDTKELIYLNEEIKTMIDTFGVDDIDDMIVGFLDANIDSIIITTEIGNGIVPMDKSAREYREIVGKAQIAAAKMSEAVYRVTAGIGQRIK